MHFYERPSTRLLQGQVMHTCTMIKDTDQSLWPERTKYVFKRDLCDDIDGAHLTSFGIEFQTEEEAKENE